MGNAGYPRLQRRNIPKSAGGPTSFARITIEEWHSVLAVNLTGAMLCCQAVLPHMIDHGFGRIVFVGSIAGRTIPESLGPPMSRRSRRSPALHDRW